MYPLISKASWLCVQNKNSKRQGNNNIDWFKATFSRMMVIYKYTISTAILPAGNTSFIPNTVLRNVVVDAYSTDAKAERLSGPFSPVQLVHLPLGLFDERVDVLVPAGLLSQQDLPLLPPLPNLRHSVYARDHHCCKWIMFGQMRGHKWGAVWVQHLLMPPRTIIPVA